MIVEVEGKGEFEVPDGTPDAVIKGIIQRDYGDKPPSFNLTKELKGALGPRARQVGPLTNASPSAQFASDPFWKTVPTDTRKWAEEQVAAGSVTPKEAKAHILDVAQYVSTYGKDFNMPSGRETSTITGKSITRNIPSLEEHLKTAKQIRTEEAKPGAKILRTIIEGIPYDLLSLGLPIGRGVQMGRPLAIEAAKEIGLGTAASVGMGIAGETGVENPLLQIASGVLGAKGAQGLVQGLRQAGKFGILKGWQMQADSIAAKKLAAKNTSELKAALASERKFRATLEDYYGKNQAKIAGTLSDVEKEEFPELGYVGGKLVQRPASVRVSERQPSFADKIKTAIEKQRVPQEAVEDIQRREAHRALTGQPSVPVGQKVIRRERTFLPESEIQEQATTGKITDFTTPIPAETAEEQLRRTHKLTQTGVGGLATGKEYRKVTPEFGAKANVTVSSIADVPQLGRKIEPGPVPVELPDIITAKTGNAFASKPQAVLALRSKKLMATHEVSGEGKAWLITKKAAPLPAETPVPEVAKKLDAMAKGIETKPVELKPQGEAKAKEPWEMTKEEFRQNTPDGFRFDPSLKYEADAHTGTIRVGPKFFELPEQARRGTIKHELGHGIEDRAIGDPEFYKLIQEKQMFGPIDQKTGQILKGINGQFKPGENLTEAYVVLFEDPAWLKKNYPVAYDYVIKEAHRLGKPVPPEVLKEYPEFAKPSGEAGFINPQLAARLGGTTAGAAIGAAADEEDPVRGAIIGGAVAFGGAAGAEKIVRRIAGNKALPTYGSANIKALDHLLGADVGQTNMGDIWDGVKTGIETGKRKFFGQVTNRHHELVLLGKELKRRTGTDFQLDEMTRLFSGRHGKTIMDWNRLYDITEPVKDLATDFKRYVSAQRMVDKFEIQGKGASKDYQTAKGAIDDLRAILLPEDFKRIDEASKQLWVWTHDTFSKPLKEAGLISEAGYQKMVGKNPRYLTMQIMKDVAETDDLSRFATGSEVFSLKDQDIVKGLKGAKEGTIWEDPFASMAGLLTKARGQIERNVIANQLFDGLLKADNNGDLIKLLPPARASANIKNPPGWDKIFRMVDGKTQGALVPKEIADAIKHFDPQQTDIATKLIGNAGSLFRLGTTAGYAPFAAANVIRDVLYVQPKMALTQGRIIWNPKEWANGYWNALKHSYGFKSELAEDFYRSGAGISGMMEMGKTPKLAAKKLFEGRTVKIAKEFLPHNFVMNLIQTTELGTRFTVYANMLKHETDSRKIAAIARDMSIDYNRAGNLIRKANILSPFLNANVQAKAGLITAIKNNPGRAATLAGIAGTATGSLYLMNEAEFPGLLERIPEKTRRDNFIMLLREPKDDKDDTWFVKIPKGDFAAALGNPIEDMLRQWKDKEPNTFAKVAGQILGDFTPIDVTAKEDPSAGDYLLGITHKFMPPIIKHPIEAAYNRSAYFGTPIVSRKLEKLPPEMQYSEDTPAFYVKAGEKLGVSPKKLEHVARGAIGALASTGISPTATGKAIVKRFFGGKFDRQKEKVYGIISDLDTQYNGIRELMKRDLAAGGTMIEAFKRGREWNKGQGKQFLDELNRRGYKSPSFSQQYTFQPADILRLKLGTIEDKRYLTPLEKRFKSTGR